MKKNKSWSLGVSILLLFFLGTAAEASVKLIDPMIGNQKIGPWTKVEAGATVRFTLRFTNDAAPAPSTNQMTTAHIAINYQTGKIDPLPTNDLFIEELALSSLTKTDPNATYCKTQGMIVIDKNAQGGAPITCAAGNSVDLAYVYFHVKQDATGDLKDLIAIDPNTLLINYQNEGIKNFSNGVPATPALLLTTPAAPLFKGLTNSSLTDPSTGQTINLSFAASPDLNKDMTDGAETLYSAGTLSYRIYRGISDTGPWTKIAPSAEKEPSHSINLKPASRVPYTAGNYTFTDNSGLNDGTTYYYRVEAMDDLAPTPQETVTPAKSITPTDTTAPGNGTLSVTPGDQKLLLSWTKPGDADYDGVVIIMNEGQAVIEGALQGASKNTFTHGTIYPVAFEPFGAGNGKVIYVGNAPPAEVSNLVNGHTYYFRAYAYDQAIGDIATQNLVKMGRNYSSGVAAQGTPGVKAGVVSNLYAISRQAEGDITIKWQNPGSQDLQPEGGIVILYSKDDANKWADIPSFPENLTSLDKVFALKDYGGAAVPENDNLKQKADLNGAALDLNGEYFFKVFTYNKTATPLTKENFLNEVKNHKFSDGIYAAAAPTLGSGTVLKTWVFQGPEAGVSFGINTFNIPFILNDPAKPVTNENGVPVPLATVNNLLAAINTQAEEQGKVGALKVFGYYDKTLKKSIGLTISQIVGNTVTGIGVPKTVAPGTVTDHPLDPKETYQLSVSNALTFRLIGSVTADQP